MESQSKKSNYWLLQAGSYWTDGGAAMGVLPRAIWEKYCPVDEKHRIRMAIRLLLVQDGERLILVDTGYGSHLTEKQIQIYQPRPHCLQESLAELGFTCEQVTDVVFTHLHFDHAGGINTVRGDKEELSFPNATHHVQRREWEIACKPDALNKAAYLYEQQLKLLDQSGNVHLLEGDASISDTISVKLVGGHSVGMQLVIAKLEHATLLYAGDIVPTQYHLPLTITSAYEISREKVIAAKSWIYEWMQETKGTLILGHDIEKATFTQSV